ncbi:hypothetical protein JCM10908_005088 [Rhodotorula pacifica]|uniref:uncharacterized protein n=1 Tax=Rhodotorula pacifica TaxID=1495444 RepID=UPI0031719C44
MGDGRRLLTAATAGRNKDDLEKNSKSIIGSANNNGNDKETTLPTIRNQSSSSSTRRRSLSATRRQALERLRALSWPRRIALAVFLVLLIRTLFRLPSLFSPSLVGNQHPIPQLIARAEAEDARRRAAEPKTLQEAYSLYQTRHGRPPPKGYDAWFFYARRNKACRIGGFDELYKSLAVWWGVDPREIRERTERLGDPKSHALGRVSVRQGQIVTWEEMRQRGMGRGAEEMDDAEARTALEEMLSRLIEDDVRLPDVDFFVNQLDEPRVLLDYDERTDLEQRARRRKPRLTQVDDLALHDINWNDAPSAYEVLRKSCAPSSGARRAVLSPHPGTHPVTSLRYASPFTAHSHLGAFITDHNLERRSWCDQPDLRDLHQTLIRPLSFSWTTQLFPIFSNSKIEGFNDILVPTWYHWYRKMPYRSEQDVEWKGKANQMFWRGTNTGGRSEGLSWMGWLRSRLVSKTNRLIEWRHYDQVLLAGNDNKTLAVTLPSSAINSALADVAFAAPDHHGDQASIETQVTEPSFRFTRVGEVPFANNYLYKLVLDMDGTAYSGRFPAIMESRSAVVKSRLYIEALDDALIPWYHYVPLSLRLTELYHLLAYFFGLAPVPRLAEEQGFPAPSRRDLDAIRHGRAHEEDLFRIAVHGREWAQQCARQDDALIYVYLLALEWARLCADDRESDKWSLLL